MNELSRSNLVHHSKDLVLHCTSQIEAHTDTEVDSNLLPIKKKKRRGNKQQQR